MHYITEHAQVTSNVSEVSHKFCQEFFQNTFCQSLNIQSMSFFFLFFFFTLRNALSFQIWDHPPTFLLFLLTSEIISSQSQFFSPNPLLSLKTLKQTRVSLIRNNGNKTYTIHCLHSSRIWENHYTLPSWLCYQVLLLSSSLDNPCL